MLDSGVLHCDPHPGNLLRASDGRLCILDWGLVTRVDSDLQYSLIDYIAHLLTEDYASIPNDLVALGFVDEGREAEIASAGVVELLSGVLRDLAKGGTGSGRIDVNAVTEQLIALTNQYEGLFRIPPYFAYILRTFTVLEGIGIASKGGDYAIVKECFPYLAKRLITGEITPSTSSVCISKTTPLMTTRYYESLATGHWIPDTKHQTLMSYQCHTQH